jgi:protein SCO1/2
LSARPSRKLLIVAGVLLVALLAGVTLFDWRQPPPPVARDAARPGEMRAGAYNPPHPAPDFALPGSDGSEVTLARYRGKVVLLTFGFTYCAAVCPTTLATLAQVRARLGKAADQVQVIFVTVDPARDDAAHMRDYLKAFDPSFIGATGTPEALAAVRQKYGVTAIKRGTGNNYAMDHTSSIFLIDREGKLRAMMPFGHDPADFVNDIQLLLA